MGPRDSSFRAIFEGVPDGLILFDPETGAVRDANEQCCAVLGYSRDALLEQDVQTLTAADWEPPRSAAERVEQARKQGSVTFEWRGRRPTGEPVPVEVALSVVTIDGESFVLARVTDVTERHERERELERKTRAMDEAPVGITISDPAQPDNPLIYVNEEFERLTGYAADDVIGRNCRFLQGEATDSEPVAKLRERIDAAEPVTVDLRNYREDGSQFWNRVTVAPVEDDDGEIVNYVGFQRDVTERKEQEAERERYERIIENLPVGVYRTTIDDDGEFQYLNRELVSLFDAPSAEALASTAVSELYADPEDRDEFLADILASGEVHNRELRFETLDGETIWGSVTAMLTQEGGETLLDGAIVDVTERKAVERRLQRQRDDLELLNEVVRHDIRNDMQLVYSLTELLEPHVDDDGQQYLDQVLESTHNAVDLTETARDLANTMLRDENDPEPVALHQVLDSELEEFEASHPETELAVDGSIPAVEVLADEMLSSVFQNLLQNAAQHNDAATPEVTVSVDQRPGTVAVHVADNGPGVPDDRKSDIFGKGEKGLDSEGTGIGLYLVQTLVDQYGGTVRVTDNEPTGAVFTVELRTVE